MEYYFNLYLKEYKGKEEDLMTSKTFLLRLMIWSFKYELAYNCLI